MGMVSQYIAGMAETTSSVVEGDLVRHTSWPDLALECDLVEQQATRRRLANRGCFLLSEPVPRDLLGAAGEQEEFRPLLESRKSVPLVGPSGARARKYPSQKAYLVDKRKECGRTGGE
jgi:hypothetical protein